MTTLLATHKTYEIRKSGKSLVKLYATAASPRPMFGRFVSVEAAKAIIDANLEHRPLTTQEHQLVYPDGVVSFKTALHASLAHPDRYEPAGSAYWSRGPLVSAVDPDNTSESLGDFIRRCDALNDDTWEDLEALDLLF